MYRFKSGVSVVFVAAAGLLMLTGAGVAQETGEKKASAAIEEVVVEAPVVHRKVAATSPTGYTTEMIQLRREVTFADLDLTDESDVKKLEERIEATAKEACEALDDMLDRDTQDPTDVFRCTKQAIKDAKKEVEAVVAAAN
ncbi:MAG TPA: UrcA family protein [Woeseiaceae bacterium]|nr:UrcA family protein [Woeseiaceae bacterium]